MFAYERQGSYDPKGIWVPTKMVVLGFIIKRRRRDFDPKPENLVVLAFRNGIHSIYIDVKQKKLSIYI